VISYYVLKAKPAWILSEHFGVFFVLVVYQGWTYSTMESEEIELFNIARLLLIADREGLSFPILFNTLPFTEGVGCVVG
jgi:hypothetical protein